MFQPMNWKRILIVGIPVLVIIGCLYPRFGKPHDADSHITKARELSNIRQVAMSHHAIAMSSPNPKVIVGNTVYEWAIDLARKGGTSLTILYVVRGYGLDRRQISEELICDPVSNQVNQPFLDMTIAYDIASGMPSDTLNLSSVPLIWTTGLQSDGTWSKDSPWGGEVGIIGYADGHTVRYDNQNKVEFIKYGTKEVTYDVSEALPPQAKILLAPKSPNKALKLEAIQTRIEGDAGEKIQLIKIGMTREEVEAIFGNAWTTLEDAWVTGTGRPSVSDRGHNASYVPKGYRPKRHYGHIDLWYDWKDIRSQEERQTEGGFHYNASSDQQVIELPAFIKKSTINRTQQL